MEIHIMKKLIYLEQVAFFIKCNQSEINFFRLTNHNLFGSNGNQQKIFQENKICKIDFDNFNYHGISP